MSSTANGAERRLAPEPAAAQSASTPADASESSDGLVPSGSATLQSIGSRSGSQGRNGKSTTSRGRRSKAAKRGWLGWLFGLGDDENNTSAGRGERDPLLGDDRSDEDGDEEAGQAYRGRVWTFGARDWRTWVTFGLLVALGILLGVLSTKGVQKWEESRDQGPLVPPVYTLPPPTYLPRNPAYLTSASHGAVASEDITCSQLGTSILRDHNGTAVDAAITTTLCIGLLNAFSSGIGGGGFMVIRKPTLDGGWQESQGGVMTAIDFRETSPKRSDKWMFGDKKAGRMAAQVGGMSVGTPGELRGLQEAHKLYDTIPWKDLVMPVAELAKQYQVSRELARRLRIFGHYMLDSPAWSEVYAPHGYLAVEGEWIKREKYGQTLETIAEKGADAFYEGDLSQKMVRTIHKAGGVLQLDDFSGYKARVYPAIHHKWGDKDVYTTAAPSSGGVLIGLLNILHPYRIPYTGGLSNALNVHRFIEALKFAFGARSWVTDPAYAQKENKERMDEVLTTEWADEVRSRIDDDKAHNASYYGIQFDTPKDAGTTHLSVVDKWGGVASVTTTINLIWGSHVMCPDTGIIMNDELADFSVPGAPDAFGLWPSPWNYPAPGKKPLSSTSPVVILQNSTFWGTFGGSGGSRIFGSVAQVLLNLEAGMNLSAAIEAPRWHNQVSPNITTLEVGPEREPWHLIKALEKRGQSVGVFDLNLGAAEVQAIVVQNGTLWASSDSRKNGIAVGY